MKKFAVFDIDGTLVRWQLYHSIVDKLAKLGHIDPGVFATVREARMQWKRRESKDAYRTYESQLVQAYESALPKLNTKQFNEAVDAVFEEHKDQVYTYTRDLITKLKGSGYALLAISGSHDEIVSRISEHYGFADSIGSVYRQAKGRFTGEKEIASLAKDEVLKQFIDNHGLGLKGSLAVGDSESDIPMLELVDQPIAFNPTRSLLDHAKAKDWKIVVERKNAIYELEYKDGGYVLA